MNLSKLSPEFVRNIPLKSSLYVLAGFKPTETFVQVRYSATFWALDNKDIAQKNTRLLNLIKHG